LNDLYLKAVYGFSFFASIHSF